jgi:hypothetical protein
MIKMLGTIAEPLKGAVWRASLRTSSKSRGIARTSQNTPSTYSRFLSAPGVCSLTRPLLYIGDSLLLHLSPGLKEHERIMLASSSSTRRWMVRRRPTLGGLHNALLRDLPSAKGGYQESVLLAAQNEYVRVRLV